MQINNFSPLFPLRVQWIAFLYKEIQFQYAKLVTCKLENLVDFSLITRFYCVYKRSLLSILLTKLVNHCICIKGCDYQNTFTLWIHVCLKYRILSISTMYSYVQSKYLYDLINVSHVFRQWRTWVDFEGNGSARASCFHMVSMVFVCQIREIDFDTLLLHTTMINQIDFIKLISWP